MLSKIRNLISSPADLIALYLFTIYHYVRCNIGWPARKFYLTAICIIAFGWELIRLVRSRRLIRERRPIRSRPDRITLITLLLGASIILTAVFSPYGKWAYDPDNVEEGALIWTVYLFIFLLMREEYHPKKAHLILYLISGYIECFLVIINNCIINIFGNNIAIYGNPNLLGLGMALLYSLNLFMLINESDPSTCLIHYILAFFFSIGLILCRSDNTLLCIMTLLALLPFLLQITADRLKKLLILSALLLLGMAAVHLLSKLPYKSQYSVTCLLMDLSLKISPVLTAASGIVFLVIQALIPQKCSFPRLTKNLRISVIVILSVLVVGIVLANVAGVSFGAANRILRIDDSWGTSRGYVWRCCLHAFGNFATPLQKIFGTGINSTPYFTWDHIREMVATLPQNFCTPHNFLIQSLLEGGILGLILICLFIYLPLQNGIKHKNCSKTLSAAMAAVILAGLLVTVPSPDITPYLIVFLAVCAAKPEKDQQSIPLAEAD